MEEEKIIEAESMGDGGRKELYRMLITDKNKSVSDKVKKYSFKQFEDKLLSSRETQDKIANYLMAKGAVNDPDEFTGKYLQVAPPPQQAPQRPVQVPTLLQPPPQAPSLTQVTGEQAVTPNPSIVQPTPEPSMWQKVKSYGNDIAKSIERGWKQGKAIQTNKLTDLATGTAANIDFDAMAKANKEVKYVGSTATEQDFQTDEGVWDNITDYAKMALPVMAESITTLIRSGAEEVGTGATTGAAVGSVVPGAGTLAGAATGATAGTAMAGYNMELYASIMDELEAKGVDISDPNQLRAAFSDKKAMAPILEKANTRAAIIGAVDLVGGIAGNASSRALSAARPLTKTGRALQKVAKAAGKLDEVATGAGGEAAAQYATTGQINPQEVALEALGEAPVVGAISKLSGVGSKPLVEPPTQLGGLPVQNVPPTAPPFTPETPEQGAEEVAVDDAEWNAFVDNGTIDPLRLGGIIDDVKSGVDFSTLDKRYQAIAQAAMPQVNKILAKEQSNETVPIEQRPAEPTGEVVESAPLPAAAQQTVEDVEAKLDQLKERFLNNGKTDAEADQLALESISDQERQLLRDAYFQGINQQQQIQPAPQQLTIEQFSNPDEFYRVIVGDEAFNDIVQNGVVRTNVPNPNATSEGIHLGNRPTAYPSFSRGKASMEYAASNPNNYIIVSSDQSIQPSTKGRHGKGSTMFPTDENGNPMRELDGKKVKVYKHLGNGQYQLVYENGQVVNQQQSPNETTPLPNQPIPVAADEASGTGADVEPQPVAAESGGPTVESQPVLAEEVAATPAEEEVVKDSPKPTFNKGKTATFETIQKKNGKVVVSPNEKPGTYDAMKMTISDDGKYATFEIDPTQVRGFNDIISDFRKVFPFISVKGVPSGRMGDAETVNKGILRKDENGDWVVEKKADVIFYGRNYNQDEPMPVKKPLDFSSTQPKQTSTQPIKQEAKKESSFPAKQPPVVTETKKETGVIQPNPVQEERQQAPPRPKEIKIDYKAGVNKPPKFVFNGKVDKNILKKLIEEHSSQRLVYTKDNFMGPIQVLRDLNEQLNDPEIEVLADLLETQSTYHDKADVNIKESFERMAAEKKKKGDEHFKDWDQAMAAMESVRDAAKVMGHSFEYSRLYEAYVKKAFETVADKYLNGNVNEQKLLNQQTNDTKSQGDQSLRGPKRIGQTPQQAEPLTGSSEKEVGPSGNVQSNEEVEVAPERESEFDAAVSEAEKLGATDPELVAAVSHSQDIPVAEAMEVVRKGEENPNTKGLSIKQLSQKFDSVKKKHAKYLTKDGGLKSRKTPKEVIDELVSAQKELRDAIKNEREQRVSEDKRDTGLVDGINRIRGDKTAFNFVRQAMTLGLIPDRLFNEFGKNLLHIKTEGLGADELLMQTMEILRDFEARENVKPDDVIAREIQRIENERFADNTESENEDIGTVSETNLTEQSPFEAFEIKGEKGRAARASLKEKVGKTEFTRLESIHKNSEKILRGLEKKGILKIECP